MKNDRSEIVHIFRFLVPANWPSVCAVLAMFLSFTPALFAQRDVHASLMAPALRKPAPAFRLTTETGRPTRLSDYRGRVVLLNFWASECGGCVLEIPSIVDIETAYEKKPFTVVGVSMDIPYEGLKGPKEAWGKVKPFMVRRKMNYPVLMGDESLFAEFGLTALPDTLLIDKSGRIAAVYVGIINKDNVEANINKLLLEP